MEGITRSWARTFVRRFVQWLSEGFLAKDKNVRARCVEIVGNIVGRLDAIRCVAFSILGEVLAL